MQLQDLPRVPLTDIFRFLGIRDRVRIESVCNESRWRDAIRHAWNDCKDIILDDLISVDNEGLSAQAKADAFRAVFKGFGPYIKFLQIKNKIGVLNFVGRYFHLIKQLTHLSIIQPMNYFNVTLIEEHLSHLLVGLQLVLINQEEALDAFISLMLKSKKLESLRINCINEIFERSSQIRQNRFLPPTLQQLYVTQYSIKALLAILEICPNLQFLLFREPRKLVTNMRILSFCSPFFVMTDIEQLNFHPRFSSLRALEVDHIQICGSVLSRIASSCPKLQHLKFNWINWLNNESLDPNDLKALYAFKNLSSLSIDIFLVSSDCSQLFYFHNFIFDDQRFDELIFDILVNLNSITPLRNLEFRQCLYCYLNKEYVFKVLTKLSLLETFKCTLAENEFLEINSINLFFEEIDRILTQSGSRSKATFRFVKSGPDFVFKWKIGCGFELNRISSIAQLDDFNLLQSVVLDEMFNNYFGTLNKRILFDTYV